MIIFIFISGRPMNIQLIGGSESGSFDFKNRIGSSRGNTRGGGGGGGRGQVT